MMSAGSHSLSRAAFDKDLAFPVNLTRSSTSEWRGIRREQALFGSDHVEKTGVRLRNLGNACVLAVPSFPLLSSRKEVTARLLEAVLTPPPCGCMALQPLEELNKHSIRICRKNRTNRSEGLRLLAEKGDAPLQESRRSRMDVRYTERKAIDPHMVQCRIRLACRRWFQPLHQVYKHCAGCLGRR